MVSSQLQPQAEAENLVSTASLSLECRLTGSELEEKETKAKFFPIHTQVQESI